MKIEKFYLLLLACFVAIGAYSQDGQQKMTGDEKSQQQSDAKVQITGQVFDESGEGIPGANVTLKSNPTSGTVTDLDVYQRQGRESLIIPEASVSSYGPLMAAEIKEPESQKNMDEEDKLYLIHIVIREEKNEFKRYLSKSR